MGDWNARFIGKRVRAAGTKTFTFERPAELDYRAGQFMFIAIPPAEEGAPWLLHHFSFSSSPTEPNIEFTTRLTGHDFKNRMDELPEGTVVRITAPDGDFVLRPQMRKVAYVAGGIGITPVRSTIKWASDTGADVDIVLLYANRDLESTAFREELDALQSRTIRVAYILSEPGPDWQGARGRIDPDFVRREVEDWAERYFFVSGPPGMARSLTRMLADDVGIAQDHLVGEYFPGYE